MPGDTDVKLRVFFSDTGPLQLSSSSLCDRLKPRTQVCIEFMLDLKGNIYISVQNFTRKKMNKTFAENKEKALAAHGCRDKSI